VPWALADQDIPVGQSYQSVTPGITVHFVELNITNEPWNNVLPPPNPQDFEWVHVIYEYENTGDSGIKAYVQPTLVDTAGREYTLVSGDYTGEMVAPHTTTRPLYVEIQVPRGTKVRQVIFVEGFDTHAFDIPDVATTPTPTATAGPGPSGPSPTPGSGASGCLPYIPFAMAGGIAAAGMVINRSGLRRR